MSGHQVMDKADRRNLLDTMKQGVIGKPLQRVDGPLKVSGEARYAHEYVVEHCAYGVFACADRAPVTIKEILADKVLKMSGVLAVIDHPQLLRNPAQGLAEEAPVQPGSKVSYSGQPVALVVAETFEQARHAANALEIRYGEVGEGAYSPDSSNAASDRPDDKQYSQGEPEAMLKSAAHSVSAVYTTPVHSSAAMEPHAAVAQWSDGKLLLHGSLQMLASGRKQLADSLDIDITDVRILSPYIGGGFGSKLGISTEAVAAAIAARQLKRPVKVALSRPQVFMCTMRRSETRQKIALGADDEGKLQVIMHDARVSNLPDEVFFEPVVQATHFTYAGAHRKIGIETLRLNRTCAGSVRAPGEAVGVQAFECAMDELAENCAVDPLALRLRNIPEKDPETGKPFSSQPFAATLKDAAEHFGWKPRFTADAPKPGSHREGEWLIGKGMAAAVRINKIIESKARVTLNADGSVLVETDMTDIGTGTYTILSQIAAELLGVPMKLVKTCLGDTDFPPASGSGGSMGASSSGSSVQLACEALREKIAERLQCKVHELNITDGKITAGNQSATLADIFDGQSISAEGHIEPGDTGDDTRQASYGGVFAEVAVNAVTGETRVRRMTASFAAGRILNEMTARSQCYGGVIWGLGMALSEAVVHDERDGRIVNHDLAEYHVPVHLDIPDIDIRFVEERDPWACPLQSKGIGELSICGSGAAIMNAIYDATGVRVRDFPATPDKLLAGLPSMESVLG